MSNIGTRQAANENMLSESFNNNNLSIYDDDDDIGIDLPLKPNLLKNRNFLDIDNSELPLMRPGQKVRFQIDHAPDGDNIDLDRHLSDSERGDNDDDTQCESVVSDSEGGSRSRSKESVEELLHHASEVNDYVAENINKLKMYPSNSASNRTLQRIMSSTNPRTESLSTFNLSDTEFDDPYNLDHQSMGSTSHFGDDETSSLDHVSTASEIQHIISDSSKNSSDTFDDNASDTTSVAERETFTFDAETCLHNVREFIERDNEMEEAERKAAEEAQDDGLTFVELSVDEAKGNFLRVIDLVIALSKREDLGDYDISETNKKHFHNFVMKNLPSLSYQDFVERIQSKCMFGSIVYQSATYLLQVLFLKKDSPEDPYKLKHRLYDNEIHRVIIASIRIATKLIEDQVHSHQYFCKVCGVTKKLLTKLEVALVMCLKDDDLVITRKMLAKSVLVIDEMASLAN